MYVYNAEDFERLAELRLTVGGVIERVTHTAVERAAVPLPQDEPRTPKGTHVTVSVVHVRPGPQDVSRAQDARQEARAVLASGRHLPQQDPTPSSRARSRMVVAPPFTALRI